MALSKEDRIKRKKLIRNALIASGLGLGGGSIYLKKVVLPKAGKAAYEAGRAGAVRTIAELDNLVRQHIKAKKLRLPNFKITDLLDTPKVSGPKASFIPVNPSSSASQIPLFNRMGPRFEWLDYSNWKNLLNNRRYHVELSSELNPKILLHELGHAQDAAIDNVKNYNLINILKDNILDQGKVIFNPKKTSRYKKEVIAWNNAGIDEDDPLRIAALKTYLVNGRAHQLRNLSNVGLIGGIGVNSSINKDKKIKR
jgi:hypothetical protein